MNLYDIIIDRSPAEKAKRVEVLRAELKTLGYSVVNSKWLADQLGHTFVRRPQPLQAAE